MNISSNKRKELVAVNIPAVETGIIGIGLVDSQNGGSGKFARVEITAHSAENPNDPNVILNGIVGGSIPTAFISSTISGCEAGLRHGPFGGYPVTGVVIVIRGGKSHQVDSSAEAFADAGRLAVRDALANAPVLLLEPVATLEVLLPPEYMGAVLGDLARRRGQIVETGGDNERSQVRATVPLAETFGYATDLRSLTQGRGNFTLEPSGYAEAPAYIAASVSSRIG